MKNKNKDVTKQSVSEKEKKNLETNHKIKDLLEQLTFVESLMHIWDEISDYEQFIKVFKNGKGKCLNEFINKWTLIGLENSKSRSKLAKKFLRDSLSVYNKHNENKIKKHSDAILVASKLVAEIGKLEN